MKKGFFKFKKLVEISKYWQIISMTILFGAMLGEMFDSNNKMSWILDTDWQLLTLNEMLMGNLGVPQIKVNYLCLRL